MSIRSPEELAALERAGRVVAETLAEVRRTLVPGMTTGDVDAIGEEVFARHGARSGPRETYGFPGCLCLSVDDEAVHGIPGDRVLRPGELLKVDVTAELGGYYADACETMAVGTLDPAGRPAARGGRRGPAPRPRGRPGRDAAAAGRRGGGAAWSRRAGFSVLRDLTGHGIGRRLHEPPTVPSWDAPWAGRPLTPGLVMTIEPIIGAGTREVVQDADGWTIRTADGARSAHAEHTIVVTDGAPLVLTAA